MPPKTEDIESPRKNSLKKTCQLYCYDHETVEVYKDTLSDFLTIRNPLNLSDKKVHWINFHDIKEREKIEPFLLANSYHRLTIEDIYTKAKRPKLEEYDNYLFFSIRSALPTSAESTKLNQEQISFILGRNYLISLQEKKSDHFTDVRDRIINRKGVIRDKGSDFLLYRMLDAVVDNYFEVLEDISKVIEKLDDQIAESSDPNLPKKIEFQKRKLFQLRKIVIPLRDIAMLLEAANHNFLSKENHHYFADLRENCLGILDEIDSNKSLLEGMASLYYAIQSQKMNEIMKVLTIVSAVFIPLTFMAGIYGMNFENIPELGFTYGYFILLGMMAIVAIAMVFYFFRKGWLKKSRL